MEKYLFHQTVKFRDLNNNSVSVEISITTRNGYPEFTMSGDMGGCGGQIDKHISPATEGQKKLLALWDKYHLTKVDPDALLPELNALVKQITLEEIDHTTSLEIVFEMGDEDFDPVEHIEEVQELRDCDYEEALAFLCLGMELGLTFGELNETFNGSDHRYTVYGIDYYVGRDNELANIAQDYLEEEDWLWIEAVKNHETELGLSDWAEWVVNMDGWANILNGWDGTSFEHKIGSVWMCGCRM